MSQHSPQQTKRENTVNASTARLSSSVKKQRSGPASTGAFGQKTGQSDLIFLEGIVPGQTDASFQNQATECLDRLESVLRATGVGLGDVVQMRVYVTDIETLETFDTVYQSRVDGTFPPRTTIGVNELPEDADVQLEVVAVDE